MIGIRGSKLSWLERRPVAAEAAGSSPLSRQSYPALTASSKFKGVASVSRDTRHPPRRGRGLPPVLG